ncbi:MAG: RagB/SusD family nutrient uptake outer membrane protein [Muribaculaceae bacterium]|nr:RagB/SusD family nutrient uptake outer membrane protein [Muribaculaceae bacterium]
MKNCHKIFAAIALGLMSLTSCTELDQFPEDKLNPSVFFHTATELELYTNQFYSLMPSVSADYNWYLEQGEHIVTPVMDRAILGQRIVPTDASEVGWNWGSLRKINYYLQNSDKCPDERARDRYDGVAYFFRAYFYFNMLTRFGELPWYDQPLASDQDQLLSKPRDSREVIMGHIIEDVDRAIALLPADRTTYTVNRWTALALKSRACLFEGTFRKYHDGDPFNPASLPWEELLRLGAEASKTLFEKGGYSLYSEGDEPYRDLFATLDARECEYIWARRCSEQVTIKNNANGWANTRAVGFTKRFVNLYLNADGSRFTDRPGYETMQYVEECTGRDPRMSQTVYCPGYVQKGDDRSYPTDLSRCPTGYKYIKYVMDVKYNIWDGSLVPLPIFRLAEAYLNYAECMAELGTISQNDLDISVNKLRTRAGMPAMNLADANANPDPYMLSDKTGYPNVTRSSCTGVILEIRRERLIELVLEGLHYNDILRWREGKVYEHSFLGQYFPGEGKYDLTGDGRANVALYTDKRPSGLGLTFLKIGTDIILSDGDSGYMLVHGDEALRRTWNEERDYLYALPINERLLTGGALTQNPGWNDGLNF